MNFLKFAVERHWRQFLFSLCVDLHSASCISQENKLKLFEGTEEETAFCRRYFMITKQQS